MNPDGSCEGNANQLTPEAFGELSMAETIHRNLRKTPMERIESLMAALRDTEQRGWWPVVDRRAKERRLLHLLNGEI